jgi:hypothetical protein
MTFAHKTSAGFMTMCLALTSLTDATRFLPGMTV